MFALITGALKTRSSLGLAPSPAVFEEYFRGFARSLYTNAGIVS